MSSNPSDHRNLYSIDGLLKSVALVAAGDFKRKIGASVRVFGKVHGIKQYPNHTFFTLKSGGSKISVQIPGEITIGEGQQLVIDGVLEAKPSSFHTGLDVMINGLPSEELPITAPPSTMTEALPDKLRYVPLASFLDSHSHEELLVIGSTTGQQDFLSRIVDCSIQTETIKVSDRQSVLNALHTHLDSGEFSAVAIVRGGDDDTIEMWDDPNLVIELHRIFEQYDACLYVALGHAHRQLLIEKFADQSFSTPTAFGENLNQFQKIKKALINRESELQTQILDSKKRVTQLRQLLVVVCVAFAVSVLALVHQLS